MTNPTNPVTLGNRRRFITQTSIAAAAALAIVPALSHVQLAPSGPAAPVPAPALAEPLTAFVRDAQTGEIALFVGTREVIVRDAALVARLVQALG